jgi:hypothetical protein
MSFGLRTLSSCTNRLTFAQKSRNQLLSIVKDLTHVLLLHIFPILKYGFGFANSSYWHRPILSFVIDLFRI